jgi:hypothetical protein
MIQHDMILFKKVYGLLFGIGVCSVVFQMENMGLFFGAFINRFSPCIQDPMNSFPCYGIYDIGMMAVVLMVGLILSGIVIFRLVQHFRKNI